MRLLALNIDNDFIKKIEDENLYICDVAEDLDDAMYHTQVRFYNLILIKSDFVKDCLKLVSAYDNNATAFVAIVENITKKEEIELLQSGAICVIKGSVPHDLLMSKIESIHRENFKNFIDYGDYFSVDKSSKKIITKDNDDMNICGKSFEILSYLVKNRYRPMISKSEIICAVWNEPEMVCNNVVEVNMSLIRSRMKKSFDRDFIVTIRHRGYKIEDHSPSLD